MHNVMITNELVDEARRQHKIWNYIILEFPLGTLKI